MSNRAELAAFDAAKTTARMRELSLFTGAGGGVYGSILLGHRVMGYAENDPHCQRVIAQRIADGIFDRAPIFGDASSDCGCNSIQAFDGTISKSNRRKSMNQIHSTALAALTSIILDLEDQLELEREAAAEATEQSADLGAEMEGARKKSKLQKFWDDKRILDLTTSLEIKRQQISFCHRQYQKDQARIDQLEHDLSSMAENADEAEDQVERLTAALEHERSKVSKWNDKFQSRIGILGDRNTRQAETLAWDAEKITELESENAELRTTLVNHIEQLAEKMEYTDELENLVARNNLQSGAFAEK